MILPERVLGSSGTIMIWRGLAIGPISLATWLRSSFVGEGSLFLLKVVGESMDDARSARVVDRFLADLEHDTATR